MCALQAWQRFLAVVADYALALPTAQPGVVIPGARDVALAPATRLRSTLRMSSDGKRNCASVCKRVRARSYFTKWHPYALCRHKVGYSGDPFCLTAASAHSREKERLNRLAYVTPRPAHRARLPLGSRVCPFYTRPLAVPTAVCVPTRNHAPTAREMHF